MVYRDLTKDIKTSWTRVVMNNEIDRLMKIVTATLDRLDLLEIGGIEGRWTLTGETDKFTHEFMNYPPHDICEMVLEKRFNLIISEMVWEHLLSPYRAARNVKEMLTKGGYFLISVPCLYPVHEYPADCTRWTPQGWNSTSRQAD